MDTYERATALRKRLGTIYNEAGAEGHGYNSPNPDRALMASVVTTMKEAIAAETPEVVEVAGLTGYLTDWS